MISESLGKLRLYLIDLLRGTRILKTLFELRKHQYMPRQEIDKIRTDRLTELFNLAKSSAKYYKKYSSYDELPVLNKTLVKEHFSDFVSRNYKGNLYKKSTSGSTGVPFTYYSTSISQSYLWAGIILAWEAGGYKLGNRVAFIAGTSLIKRGWKHRLFYSLLNVDLFYASPLNDKLLQDYIERIQKRKIQIIYGYAGIINAIANYLNNHDGIVFPDLKGIICTAEMLTKPMRLNIEKGFRAKVFNQYGCNEGGISAFECEHQNLHLISTRAFYEIDKNGALISTDLSNSGYIMLKYNTNDLVEILEDKCRCRRTYPVIKKIIGRSTDLVVDLSGNVIHDSLFSYLFGSDNSIKNYQILFDNNSITVRLSTDSSKRIHDYAAYINLIKKNLKFKDYLVEITDTFLTGENGKHRQVIDNRF